MSYRLMPPHVTFRPKAFTPLEIESVVVLSGQKALISSLLHNRSDCDSDAHSIVDLSAIGAEMEELSVREGCIRAGSHSD
jgi:hypothetical protein